MISGVITYKSRGKDAEWNGFQCGVLEGALRGWRDTGERKS